MGVSSLYVGYGRSFMFMAHHLLSLMPLRRSGLRVLFREHPFRVLYGPLVSLIEGLRRLGKKSISDIIAFDKVLRVFASKLLLGGEVCFEGKVRELVYRLGDVSTHLYSTVAAVAGSLGLIIASA